jgi:hypothetical protein
MESSFIKTPELKLKVNFENRLAVYHSAVSPKPMRYSMSKAAWRKKVLLALD